MEILHLRAQFPGLYASHSATAAVATPAAAAPTTEDLFEEAAPAADVAVNNSAVARVRWTHIGSPNPVVRERTPAPPELLVRGRASISTTTATLEELSEDAPDGHDRNVPSRATTAQARNPLVSGTKLGSDTGGSGGGSGGGVGGPRGVGGGNDGPGPGEGGGPGQAAGGLEINLEEVIRTTVSALVTAAMAGAANITCAAVEARLATEETGGGLS